MSIRFFSYNPKLKEIAKKLRKQGIISEVILWSALKGKKLKGYSFHRQKPLGNYIVDFFCVDLALAIEIDGSSHIDKVADDTRQRELEKMGVKFLRFYDEDVMLHLTEVIEIIEKWVEKNTI